MILQNLAYISFCVFIFRQYHDADLQANSVYLVIMLHLRILLPYLDGET